MQDSSSDIGFTLMEVVVAMVLVSMVTLIAALGFRLAVRAWERGIKEDNSRQVSTAVPALLARQLDSVKRTVSFGKGQNKTLLFFGNEKGMSFFTSYEPQGSSVQGLVRVTYVFNKDRKRLLIFEQSITRLQDITDEKNPLSDKWDNELAPVSIIDNIDNFSLVFLNKTNRKDNEDTFDDVKWKTSWDDEKRTLPGFVKLTFEQVKNTYYQKWYFRVGHG